MLWNLLFALLPLGLLDSLLVLLYGVSIKLVV